MSNDKDLRSSLIRLAHTRPEFRDQLLPLLKTAKFDRADLIQELGGIVSFAEEAHDKLEEHLEGASPEVARYLKGCIKACTDLAGSAETAQETAMEPEKPAKKAAIRGFDGIQKDTDKFSKDLVAFHSQLETDIESAPQAFKVLYKPLLTKLESVQPVLKELSAAAKKVDDALAKSREKTSGKPSKK